MRDLCYEVAADTLTAENERLREALKQIENLATLSAQTCSGQVKIAVGDLRTIAREAQATLEPGKKE